MKALRWSDDAFIGVHTMSQYIQDNLFAMIQSEAAKEFSGNGVLDMVGKQSIAAIVAAGKAGGTVNPGDVQAAVIALMGKRDVAAVKAQAAVVEVKQVAKLPAAPRKAVKGNARRLLPA